MILASRAIIESTDRAWYWLGGISLALFIGILGCLIYFVIRYSRKRHPKSEHIPGNMKLEITWTILPTLLSCWLFFLGLEGFQLMRNPPADAYEITVVARQWSWEFIYPNEGVSSSELYVPIDTPVKLNLSSPIDDVIHSFYLPDFRVKEDCVPGLPTFLWFEADKLTGDHPHNIFCAEFCGQDHSRMISVMHVLTKKDWNAWLDRKVAERYKPVDAAVALNPKSEEIVACDAPKLYATYCASCHGTAGQGGLVAGARDFRSAQGWKKGSSVGDIFRTVTEGLDGTQMRSFGNLSAWDRFALAHHVEYFYKGGGREDTTLAECEALVKEYKLDEPPVITRDFPIEAAMESLVTGAK